MPAVARAAPAPVRAPAPGAAPAPARPASVTRSAPRVALTGGAPIPTFTRARLETSLGADLSGVRLHSGPGAAALARGLGARAFAYGPQIVLGADQRADDLQVVAHEVAHVLQQGGAPQPRAAGGAPRFVGFPAVVLGGPARPPGRPPLAHAGAPVLQSWTPLGANRFESEANRAALAVVRGQPFTVVERTGPCVQPLLGIDIDIVGRALDYLAPKANALPGFRMFTVVLGVNPINMSPVDRSPANVLRAVIEFIPGGALITQALDNYGIIDKVGGWVAQQIQTLGLVGGSIKDALLAFVKSLGVDDLGDLGGVWERAKRVFTEPINRIIGFVGGLAAGIITFIKDALLMPLAGLAEGTRGWDLLIAVLGKNPITGAPVPRTAETLIPGFLKLIGQEEVWNNMKQARALPRAWAWFQGALGGLMGFVNQIPSLAVNAFKSLELVDIVLVPRAFAKVAVVFGGFLGQFITWAGTAVWNLLEIIFDVVSPGALGYVKRTGAALKNILKNPLPFVGNLVKAAKLGFETFAGNFGTHLKAGLIDWLTGSLPGVYIPKAFSLGEIVKFVLSVLGLSWANVRQKLVKAVGEPVVKALEVGFDVVVTLVKEGPAAAWEKIKDQLADLKDMVIGGITDFVIDMVVKKAVPKLIALFIPGAGFISAILSIYETIMVFVAKLAKIVAVVTGFIDSIVAIAAGNIGAAASRVETVLAGLLSLAINFLAGFIGLGKVADKVMGVINKVRALIDKALDWLVNWIVTAAKKLGGFLAEKAGEALDWLREKLGFTNSDGESHTLSFRGTEDNAQLMIATAPQPVEAYLAAYEPKDEKYAATKAAFDAAKGVIFTPAKKTEAERRARRDLVRSELAKLSAAFARLAGDPPADADYGPNTEPTYDNPARVEVISGQPRTGSVTGAWPVNVPGYKEIFEAGLTTATDKWVQMHIISEKLGGSGSDLANLVPAPNSVNTGPFRSFESAVAALAQAKSGKIRNRVWVEVAIGGTKTHARSISGSAGLYLWKGKKASPAWLKNAAPSLSASAGIPEPQLKGPRKLVLNFTSGTEMTRDFGISSETAALVKQGRPYASLGAFIQSMRDRGATESQIQAVLSRGPVLDGP